MVGLTLTILLGRAIGLVLGFTIHEWAHAYSAERLGGRRALPDPSRLSLDPRLHIEPFGIFLALFAGFGWAKPVPVNPTAFFPKVQQSMMIVAFAGPLTNLLIGIFFGIALRIMYLGGVFVDSGFILVGSGATIVEGSNGVYNAVYEVLATVVFFNLLLFVFNLIPLAPLDGWKVMMGLLPREMARDLSRFEKESMYLLFFLILLGFIGVSPIFEVLGPIIDFLFELITGFGYYVR